MWDNCNNNEIIVTVNVAGVQGPQGVSVPASGDLQSGVATGLFYPLNNNPAGYLASGISIDFGFV